jgi:hypothetical protein
MGFAVNPGDIFPSSDALVVSHLREIPAAAGQAAVRPEEGSAAHWQRSGSQPHGRGPWFVPVHHAGAWQQEEQQQATQPRQQQEQGAGAGDTAEALYGCWAAPAAAGGMQGAAEPGGAAGTAPKPIAQPSAEEVMAVSQALVIEHQGATYAAEQEFERLCVKLQVGLLCVGGLPLMRGTCL